ncbi:MAG: bifunctional nuclease family protein [Kiritimatiellae bacterium]|nr:bifunctional nuclease family protein [Kiritimatiellia bacterium]
MIPVNVDQLFLSNLGFVVLLKGETDERTLPIFIGAAEAHAIAIKLNHAEVPRPLTHDLLKNILDFLEYRLKRVEVCDLREGTFYARLILERNGEEMGIDSRPSDAIALALRCGAPIFVDERVMDEAGRVLEKNEEGMGEKEKTEESGTEKEKEKKKPSAPLSPVEAIQLELERAIKEERYEDAARLRDKLRRLKDSNRGN